MRLIRNLLILVLVVGAAALGWMVLKARQDARESVPILTYHYFSSDQYPHPQVPPGLADYYIVSERDFERQLDYLAAHGYHTVSFTDLCRATRYSDLPAKPVVVTVDHEALDRLRIAVPALARRHMTATFFVVTDWIGLPGNLGAADLKAMVAAGMDVQSHTKSHPSMNEVSRERQALELSASKRELEAMTGRPVLTLAPPGGKWNQVTVEECRRAGYIGFRDTDPGLSHVGDYVYHASTLPAHMSDADFARLFSPGHVATSQFVQTLAHLAQRVLGARYVRVRAFLLKLGLGKAVHSPRGRLLVLGGMVLALLLLISALSPGRRR